jgi:hypothetical protein
MSTPNVARTTTCKHCGQTFDGGVEIIGRPNARMESLLLKLGSHMNTKHPEHARYLQLQGASYLGLVFLTNFNSTDAELHLQRDRHRWEIHQQTLNARFSDESLRKQCMALMERIADAVDDNLGEECVSKNARELVAAMLLEAMTSVRDALEEPNRYSEAKTEELVS